MFQCNDCQQTFEEPKGCVEYHSLESPPYERWDGCPTCGGAFRTAIQCSCCGKFIDGTYIKIKNNQLFCEHCYVVCDTDYD